AVPVRAGPAPAVCLQPAGAGTRRRPGYLDQPGSAESLSIISFGGARAADHHQRRAKTAARPLAADRRQGPARATVLVAVAIWRPRRRARAALRGVARAGAGQPARGGQTA